MKKIAIVLTQPIEYSTSSMIRCRTIVNALIQQKNEVICLSPYADTTSKYYDSSFKIDPQTTIIRYGHVISYNERKKSQSVFNALGTYFVKLIYCLYKKVDLFGSSIKNIKYKKQICGIISKSNVDVLLTFSDPKTSHIVGGFCKRNNPNLKYIQQWGDPMSLDISSKTIVPRCIIKNIEKKLLKYADRICYVSPLTLDSQKKIFECFANRMFFLPTPCLMYEKKTSSIVSKKVTIGYFGSYNSAVRDLRPFYEAACNMNECNFFIVGDSDLKLRSTENIRVVDRVPHEELEMYLNDIDVLVCLMNNRGGQIPGKVYHYAGSYKEILFIKDGEYGEEIETFFSQYNRYTFVENDSEKILKTFRNYIEKGIPKRQPLEHFNAYYIANDLLNKT